MQLIWKFTGPSIQVRRQDKFRETPFIEVGKYVEHIEEYFDILDAKISSSTENNLQKEKQNSRHNNNARQKAVFVATDEPKVLTELSLRFPKFHWVTRNGTSDESASILKNRYSNNGQDAIIKDVFVLAFSDFLVSTW